MSIVSMIFVAIIALEHLFIAWVEIFAWTSRGPKMFPHLSIDFLKSTKEMAANQGLYNLFLVAGLMWSLLIRTAPWNIYMAAFFLGCVIVAGIFGALTSNKSIFFKQALPAIIAMIVLCVAQ
ncbi:DUF1304 domain-containing protein [Scatolibacter rhodanostii]|uniref:DUF1304 domain-containing protein n=1 Tax=Scatolibacter rhodanostii TaxID=2014781 RepID=UPI000C0721C2|nr:DUF1304 domain-containing protein [Scatolibacter rhodanostii]